MLPDAAALAAHTGALHGLIPRTQPFGATRAVARTAAGGPLSATRSFADGARGR